MRIRIQLFITLQIRIQLFTILQIRIQLFILMPIRIKLLSFHFIADRASNKNNADPDPQLCWSEKETIWILVKPSVADPRSGAFLTPGSGMGETSGSGYGINNPDHISDSLETIFGFKFLNSLMRIREGKIRIRDGKGSGIRIHNTGKAWNND